MKLIIFRTTIEDNGRGSYESYPSEWDLFPVLYDFAEAKKEIIKDFQTKYRNCGTDDYFVIPSFYRTETVVSITFSFFEKGLSFKRAMKAWKENKWRINPDASITYDIVDVDAIK
jgi:hypothetical protein